MIEISLANKCANADFQKIFARKGYAFFTKGEYNLNIIGVRHKGAKVTNHFDDCLVVIYNTGNEKNVKRVFTCTTLPGKKAMEHPMQVKGTAILKEGQYRGAWKIGYHKGKYKALCQAKPVPVYRDGKGHAPGESTRNCGQNRMPAPAGSLWMPTPQRNPFRAIGNDIGPHRHCLGYRLRLI